jgi:hypothetical protein
MAATGAPPSDVQAAIDHLRNLSDLSGRMDALPDRPPGYDPGTIGDLLDRGWAPDGNYASPDLLNATVGTQLTSGRLAPIIAAMGMDTPATGDAIERALIGEVGPYQQESAFDAMRQAQYMAAAELAERYDFGLPELAAAMHRDEGMSALDMYAQSVGQDDTRTQYEAAVARADEAAAIEQANEDRAIEMAVLDSDLRAEQVEKDADDYEQMVRDEFRRVTTRDIPTTISVPQAEAAIADERFDLVIQALEGFDPTQEFTKDPVEYFNAEFPAVALRFDRDPDRSIIDIIRDMYS